MTHWAILTGEYPPQPGGVSDYTRLVARGLAAAGDKVTVYAPAHSGTELNDWGVAIQRLPDRFGPRSLMALESHLNRSPRPTRILLQYVPHAFGWKAMNFPFTAWVAHRAASFAPLWVMFHEVMSGVNGKRPIKNALLTTATRQMARQLARAAERIFVSIPFWGGMLRRIAHSAAAAEWLPIPSNFSGSNDPERIAAIRSSRPKDSKWIGHFGTFGTMNADMLPSTFLPLLRKSLDRFALFVGRGSQSFRDKMAAAHPELAARIAATGELPSEEAIAHIASCDLLIQPYPDGASSRRTSLMAGLALGVPTVTNRGILSEPMWGTESSGVVVVESPEPAALAAAAEAVLALTLEERSAFGSAASAWYRSRFAPELTISRLRSPRPEAPLQSKST